MTDLRKTIIPKSDQLNADDLIGVSKTVKITKVSLSSEVEQPIAMNYEGDNGKPYKPCKSMRRVLVNVWGADGNKYIGRSMTLFRDDKVKFGGLEVGGIRISHMSDIDAPVTMALTASKASRKPYTVKPLVVDAMPLVDIPTLKSFGLEAAELGKDEFTKWWNSPDIKPHREALKPFMDEFQTAIKGE
jgi:hypothetical protein